MPVAVEWEEEAWGLEGSVSVHPVEPELHTKEETHVTKDPALNVEP